MSQNLIHFTDFSSSHFLEALEKFSKEVRDDTTIEDDHLRWDPRRVIKYGFNECLATAVDGAIVNMTFNKWYGSFLRVGINSYTLSPFRREVFRPLWRAGGYMDRTHLTHQNNAKGYFCSFYPKNSKIQSVVKMLKQEPSSRRMSFGGEPSGWLDRFRIFNPNPISFRNVPQYISYSNVSGPLKENLKELETIIQNDSI